MTRYDAQTLKRYDPVRFRNNGQLARVERVTPAGGWIYVRLKPQEVPFPVDHNRLEIPEWHRPCPF